MIQEILNALASQYELFLRLLLACLSGAIIGFERSVRRKDAGIKTHIILALGAALFMIVSQYGFSGLDLSPELKADVSRIASNIVTGVSFLCAGVIFVRGASVKGLTTATGIWTTAGIGMAAGAGMYGLTIFTTCLILVIQLLLAGFSAKIETHYSLDVELRITDQVHVNDVVSQLSEITQAPAIAIKMHKEQDCTCYKVNFNITHTVDELDLIHKMNQIDSVSGVTWNLL